MRFNEKMRRLLEWSGRSMRELAEELNVPTTTLSNWLNTGTRPRRDKLEALSRWGEREFGVKVPIGDLTDEKVGLKWQGSRPAFVEHAAPNQLFDGHPRYVEGGLADLELCELPILGQVPAGALADMSEEMLGSQVLPKTWRGGIDQCFVLRVKGDSMLPTLRDGELVVCDASRAPYPRDGQIVVARHQGEETLKEFLRQETKTLLVPHNRDYPTVAVSPDELEIVAVVVGRWQAMPNV